MILLLRTFSNRCVIEPSTFSVPSDSSFWWIAVNERKVDISFVDYATRFVLLTQTEINTDMQRHIHYMGKICGHLCIACIRGHFLTVLTKFGSKQLSRMCLCALALKFPFTSAKWPKHVPASHWPCAHSEVHKDMVWQGWSEKHKWTAQITDPNPIEQLCDKLVHSLCLRPPCMTSESDFTNALVAK